MTASAASDNIVVTDDQQEWKRLLASIRGGPSRYEIYDVVKRGTSSQTKRRRSRRVRRIGGYLSRADALTDQQKKYADYLRRLEAGDLPLEDVPTQEGFRKASMSSSRTNFWRIYTYWGLLFPPTRGFDPEWLPPQEDGWEAPS